LLAKAADLGVRFLSITDHDSTEGLEQALQLPLPADLKLIPGIEVSAGGESPCHILGYGIRVADSTFQKKLAEFREQRIGRLRAMVDRLKELGIEISFERVKEIAGAATLGRPHLADALVEKKVVRSRKEAFQKYLNHNGSAYVAGNAPPSRDIIALIRAAGGVPVLAHPAYYCNEEYLKTLADEGLMGLEVYYPDVSRALRERFLVLAKQFNLIATGGSDYHGPRTGRSELACVDVPETVIDELLKCQVL
jgi:predicted metal-dependent phosphoesterase TrpH